MSTARDIRLAQNKYLGSVEIAVDDFVDSMNLSLRTASKAIEKSFATYLDALETGPGGWILDTADNRRLLNALQAKIDAETQLHLLARGRIESRKALRRTHRAGRVNVIETIPGAKVKLNATDARQITAYTKLSHQYIAQLDGDTADYIRSVLTKGSLEGWSPRQVANAIVEGGKLKAGPVHTVETRAELWARTEPARVAEEANLARHMDATGEDNPWGQWIAQKDRRTGPDSLRRHGKVRRRSKWRSQPVKGDKFKGLPPLRPRDRCSIQWLQREDWTDEQWQQIKAGTPFYQVAA